MINSLIKRFVSIDEGTEQSTAARSNRQTNGPTIVPSFPSGVNPVGAELQRKFATGIDYNMKILIRGDRNTGKTSLWRRLQGMPFQHEEEGDMYTQTEEIQVASIIWNYRARDFVVKLDVWDVVDKGRRADSSVGSAAPLKFATARKCAFQFAKNVATADIPAAVQEVLQNSACDASTVNVYNGCDGVVFLFDVSRDWTWAYICRELPSVPAHIPVLVMANKMDLISPDKPKPSTIDECLKFLRAFNERCKPCPDSSAAQCSSLPLPIRFARASMKRALGLKFLYNFLNIPFLHVQQNFLKRSMESNLREIQITEDELDILAEEEGQNPSTWRKLSAEMAKQRNNGECERENSEQKDQGEEGQSAVEGQTSNDKRRTKCAQFGGDRRRPSSLSSVSSSELANPHVSTYAEDFDGGEDGQFRR